MVIIPIFPFFEDFRLFRADGNSTMNDIIPRGLSLSLSAEASIHFQMMDLTVSRILEGRVVSGEWCIHGNLPFLPSPFTMLQWAGNAIVVFSCRSGSCGEKVGSFDKMSK